MSEAIRPKVEPMMSQKVAAQAVPVLGAAAGATINTVFANYYREMARIHFRALAIARDRGEDPETALSRLRRAARALRAEQGIKRIP